VKPFAFEPWMKPTGGLPLPLVVAELVIDGRRHVINASGWCAAIVRADGRRELLLRMVPTPIEPGDAVAAPDSRTEDVPLDAISAAEIEGRVAYDRAHWTEFDDQGNVTRPPRDPDRMHWHRRALPGGHQLEIGPHSYGNVVLRLMGPEQVDYDGVWVYRDHDAAWRAVLGWNGEGDPEGWYRCYQTGRRREDGTPASEHYQP
jgi:hypothetical protein